MRSALGKGDPRHSATKTLLDQMSRRCSRSPDEPIPLMRLIRALVYPQRKGRGDHHITMLFRAAAVVVVDALDRVSTAAASKRARKVVRPGGREATTRGAVRCLVAGSSCLFCTMQEVATLLLQGNKPRSGNTGTSLKIELSPIMPRHEARHAMYWLRVDRLPLIAKALYRCMYKLKCVLNVAGFYVPNISGLCLSRVSLYISPCRMPSKFRVRIARAAVRSGGENEREGMVAALARDGLQLQSTNGRAQ